LKDGKKAERINLKSRVKRESMQLSLLKAEPWPPWIYKIKKLVISEHTDFWCRLPYRGHPKGCPNYGKKQGCPPCRTIESWFDVSRPLYLVHSEFDLKSHTQKMLEAHPKWSERQAKCCLYWQGTARKQLRRRIWHAEEILGTDGYNSCPEALGVNVFVTARKSGLILEKTKILNSVRHVALLGFKP